MLGITYFNGMVAILYEQPGCVKLILLLWFVVLFFIFALKSNLRHKIQHITTNAIFRVINRQYFFLSFFLLIANVLIYSYTIHFSLSNFPITFLFEFTEIVGSGQRKYANKFYFLFRNNFKVQVRCSTHIEQEPSI